MDVLASRLREETKVTIDVIQADLAQQEDLAEVETRLREDTSIGIFDQQRCWHGPIRGFRPTERAEH
jgi:Ni2+-binding GTPase involved in maturation of urease and hydrogenase